MSDERHSEAAPREDTPREGASRETSSQQAPPEERNPSLGEAISDEDAAGSTGGAQGDARYASQAAMAEPAPVALEGGASVPGGGSAGGGTTRRREWVFLMLAVLFSLALVSVPAFLFTSIDLAGAGEEGAGGDAAAPGEAERLQLLQETRADALSKLYTYGPSEDTGGFRIPLERAMRLTLEEDYQAAAGAPLLKPAIPGGAQRSNAPAAAAPDSAAAQR